MKRIFLTTTAALVLCGSMALAVTPQEVIADLQGQGYKDFEVKVGPGQIKVEASNGTDKLEVVVDKETGDILKSELSPGQGGEVDPGIEIDERNQDFVDGDNEDGDDGDDDGNGEDDNSGQGGGNSGSGSGNSGSGSGNSGSGGGNSGSGGGNSGSGGGNSGSGGGNSGSGSGG